MQTCVMVPTFRLMCVPLSPMPTRSKHGGDNMALVFKVRSKNHLRLFDITLASLVHNGRYPTLANVFVCTDDADISGSRIFYQDRVVPCIVCESVSSIDEIMLHPCMETYDTVMIAHSGVVFTGDISQHVMFANMMGVHNVGCAVWEKNSLVSVDTVNSLKAFGANMGRQGVVTEPLTACESHIMILSKDALIRARIPFMLRSIRRSNTFTSLHKVSCADTIRFLCCLQGLNVFVSKAATKDVEFNGSRLKLFSYYEGCVSHGVIDAV